MMPYLLTSSRLQAAKAKGVELTEGELFVPAYDRHLFFTRSWDRYYRRQSDPVKTCSLLILHPGEDRLELCRGLSCASENPNIFEFQRRLSAPLVDVQMLPDEEFVFP